MSRAVLEIPTQERTNVIAGLPGNMPLLELQYTRELLTTQRSFIERTITHYDQAIAAFGASATTITAGPSVPTQVIDTGKPKRVMSAATKKKLKIAQAKRWEAKRAADALAAGQPAPTAVSKPRKRKARAAKPMTQTATA